MISWLTQLFSSGARRIDIAERFTIIGPVGHGSMSKVWKARDGELQKVVALKILDEEKTKKFESRFHGLSKPGEGEVAVQLEHPHIVRSFETGLTTKGEAFLVMEYLEGGTLASYVGQDHLADLPTRFRWLRELAQGIVYLHASGFVHRDISPRNAMVDAQATLKIIDFGLTIPRKPEFFRPGNRTGTTNYLAPEVIRRKNADERVDVFAFAVTCFQVLSGELPWEKKKSTRVEMQHINQPPKQLHDLMPELDPKFADAVMKGLASDPDRRWTTVARMLANLERFGQNLKLEDQSPQPPAKQG